MATHSGQHEIEQDQRWQKALYVVPSRMSVGGHSGGEMGLTERAIKQRRMERLVFNNLDDHSSHGTHATENLFRIPLGYIAILLTPESAEAVKVNNSVT